MVSLDKLLHLTASVWFGSGAGLGQTLAYCHVQEPRLSVGHAGGLPHLPIFMKARDGAILCRARLHYSAATI